MVRDPSSGGIPLPVLLSAALIALLFFPSAGAAAGVRSDTGADAPWTGVAETVDVAALADAYNSQRETFPQWLLSAVADEHLMVYVYANGSGVRKGDSREAVAFRSAVFNGTTLERYYSVELPDPTLRVYLTEEAFYGLLSGVDSLEEVLDDKSLRYEMDGLWRRLRFLSLRLKCAFGGCGPLPPAFRETLVASAMKQPASPQRGVRVELCASLAEPESGARQQTLVWNCSSCQPTVKEDTCKGLFTLIEQGCNATHLIAEEVDCSDEGMLCSEGACVRDTRKSASFAGLTSAERLFALSARNLSCWESDSGDAPEEEGTLFSRGCANCSVERADDICISSSRLREQFCSPAGPYSAEHACLDGAACLLGACRPRALLEGRLGGSLGRALAAEERPSLAVGPCSDTDAGDDVANAGTVSLSDCPTCAPQTFPDECITSAVIRERYCAGSQLRERTVDCRLFGLGYCSLGACTDKPKGDAYARRDEEEMSAVTFFERHVNGSGLACVRQRRTGSVAIGDSRDRLFFQACPQCNHTLFEEDCLSGTVYEFECASSQGPPEVRTQSCAPDICYLGTCVSRGDVEDVLFELEERRQAAFLNMSNCTDSDGGIATGVFGWVEVRPCPFCPPVSEQDIFPDSCIDAAMLAEQRCLNESRKTERVDCGRGGNVCRSGACVLP